MVKNSKRETPVSENDKIALVMTLTQLKEPKSFPSVDKFCDWINSELKIRMTPNSLYAFMKRSPNVFTNVKIVRTGNPSPPIAQLYHRVERLETADNLNRTMIDELTAKVKVMEQQIKDLNTLLNS